MAVHVRDVAKMVEVIAHSAQELAGSMYRQLPPDSANSFIVQQSLGMQRRIFLNGMHLSTKQRSESNTEKNQSMGFMVTFELGLG